MKAQEVFSDEFCKSGSFQYFQNVRAYVFQRKAVFYPCSPLIDHKHCADPRRGNIYAVSHIKYNRLILFLREEF